MGLFEKLFGEKTADVRHTQKNTKVKLPQEEMLKQMPSQAHLTDMMRNVKSQAGQMTLKEGGLDEKFSDWLDNVLEKHKVPKEVKAFCFNIYEDEGNRWSVELIGTERFDEEDDDWPCDEVTDFGTRKHPYTWKADADWEDIFTEVKSKLRDYIWSKGRYSSVLKSRQGVGVGFVDGDLEIIYPSEQGKDRV